MIFGLSFCRPSEEIFLDTFHASSVSEFIELAISNGHDGLTENYDDDTVKDILITRVGLLEVGENCQTRTFQCHYCYTDYIVDGKDFGDRGFAVITTKWVNFGSGRESPDLKWESHGAHSKATGEHRRRIRADFENHTELPLKDFTADNERRLFSTRKRKKVTIASDGCVWRWRLETRWKLDPPNSKPSIWERWLWW